VSLSATLARDAGADGARAHRDAIDMVFARRVRARGGVRSVTARCDVTRRFGGRVRRAILAKRIEFL
jgi:hypothetical protein